MQLILQIFLRCYKILCWSRIIKFQDNNFAITKDEHSKVNFQSVNV